MGKYLTREAVLGAQDIPTEDVAVPEWGGTLLVRGMTGQERDDYEASIMTGKGRNREVLLRNARAKLVARCCVDEAGKRTFADEDVRALGGKSAAALERVFEVASRLSGITPADMEELTKNSESAPSDDSGSV